MTKIKTTISFRTFILVPCVLGFLWMCGLLGLVTSLSPVVLIVTAMIAGPVCAIGFVLFLISRGVKSIVHIAVWFALMFYFLLTLFLLERWTSLGLIWAIPLAILLTPLVSLVCVNFLGVIAGFFEFAMGKRVRNQEPDHTNHLE